MPSAFIQFSNLKRDEVKAANPKAGFGDLGKILGKMWQKLSEEEKAKYASTSSPKKKSKSSKKTAVVEEDAAEEVKETEAKETEAKETAAEETDEVKETAADGEESAVSTKPSSNKTMSKKSKKSITKKKRPLSAFIVFCNEKRDQVKKENPNASFGEIGKILGKLWREKKGEK